MGQFPRLDQRELHYDNTPIQYTVIFSAAKNDNFLLKNLDIFLIFAQNTECVYTLGGSNEYQKLMFKSKNKGGGDVNFGPCKPQFYYINSRNHGMAKLLSYECFLCS